jgi:hypothetical protein
MKHSDIAPILEQTRLPVTYGYWPEGHAPKLPYLVWYLPGSVNMAADDAVYQRIDDLNVELYTKTKDFATEAAVEAVLDGAGLVWDKEETYLSDEHMYEVLYTMEVIING